MDELPGKRRRCARKNKIAEFFIGCGWGGKYERVHGAMPTFSMRRSLGAFKYNSNLLWDFVDFINKMVHSHFRLGMTLLDTKPLRLL